MDWGKKKNLNRGSIIKSLSRDSIKNDLRLWNLIHNFNDGWGKYIYILHRSENGVGDKVYDVFRALR